MELEQTPGAFIYLRPHEDGTNEVVRIRLDKKR